MPATETPIEEWRIHSRSGREYTTLSGPGGGLVYRQGSETIDEARARRAIELEAKRATARHRAAGDRKPTRKGKGRGPDPTPKPGSTKPAGAGAKPRPTRDQLAAAAELPFAVFGAFAGRAIWNCEYCAGAMQAAAPDAARDLAKTENPYLLNLLVWWHGLVAAFAGGDGLARYLAPPLIHHVAPAPMAAFVGPFFPGMPPRQPKPQAQPHGHGPARAETVGPVPGEAPPPPGSESGAGPATNGGGPQAMTPERAAQLAGEHAALSAEAARLRSVADMAARQRAAAAQAAAAQPNMPPYRADQAAPGTPTAPPPPPGADPMGSPLPPEAGG